MDINSFNRTLTLQQEELLEGSKLLDFGTRHARGRGSYRSKLVLTSEGEMLLFEELRITADRFRGMRATRLGQDIVPAYKAFVSTYADHGRLMPAASQQKLPSGLAVACAAMQQARRDRAVAA